jgi:hypothetical protein
MGAIDDRFIEAAARKMLRKRIKAMPSYRIRMMSAERQKAIELEVETYWHLFIADAAKHLHEPTEDDER